MNQQQWETMGASPEMAKALADSDDCLIRAQKLLMHEMSRRMFEKLNAEFCATGSKLTVGITLPLAEAARTAADLASDFENSMSKLKQDE
jgi:hypothetical protein